MRVVDGLDSGLGGEGGKQRPTRRVSHVVLLCSFQLHRRSNSVWFVTSAFGMLDAIWGKLFLWLRHRLR